MVRLTTVQIEARKSPLAGTVDQVKAEGDAPRRVGGDGDLEWFAHLLDQGAMPWQEKMR
jgi:hypothetical protein